LPSDIDDAVDDSDGSAADDWKLKCAFEFEMSGTGPWNDSLFILLLFILFGKCLIALL
jgi:hypothetical protein